MSFYRTLYGQFDINGLNNNKRWKAFIENFQIELIANRFLEAIILSRGSFKLNLANMAEILNEAYSRRIIVCNLENIFLSS